MSRVLCTIKAIHVWIAPATRFPCFRLPLELHDRDIHHDELPSGVLDGRYRLIRNRFGTDRNEESIWQNGNELKRVEPTEESTEKVMDVGQKVVFVRAVKGAEVGKHGTVMKVADDMVVVDCTLQEHLVPVLAQMWDVLPERLWEHLLKRRSIAPRTSVPFDPVRT